MEYSTPEIVVLGSASTLILGDHELGEDSAVSTGITKPPMGVVLGLDD